VKYLILGFSCYGVQYAHVDVRNSKFRNVFEANRWILYCVIEKHVDNILREKLSKNLLAVNAC
jgi:hypothetical protein